MKTRACITRYSLEREQGFTLLEALLAVFVFSLAVVALVQAVNDMGRGILRARVDDQIHQRLELLLMEKTRLSAEPMTVTPQGENVAEFEENGVLYRTTIKDAGQKNQDQLELTNIMEVTVTALWKEGREEQEASLQTWVYPALFLSPP